MQKLLRIQDVAIELGISRVHAYRLARSGSLPIIRIGPHSIRVTRADLDAWLASLAEAERQKRSDAGK